MKIADIISTSLKPSIYEAGTSFMWTDEYISKQLLNIHLNPDIDLCSRKMSTILETANWILSTQKSNNRLNILDLGCGPGLYAEIFAQQGHRVTGIDISKTSIDYAKSSASENKLDITYQNANYLNLDLEAGQFDMVLLIYTDLGVLRPGERDRLLKMIYRVLKKGGVFIFDVLKDNGLESKITPKTWEAANSGFWKDVPYLALSESFLYKEQKVILFQNIILYGKEDLEIYRFWTHFFSQNDVTRLLNSHGFNNIQFREDILPKGDKWNGDNVLFSIASK
jgi:2-polyprenyl-3-methyl-5-hydroxy-6-metoxy-1,4-benzoquinol methylase